MKTHIKTKNIDLTDSIKSHVETKVSELEKFIHHPLESVEVWVEVGKSTMHHKQGDVFEAVIDVKMPGNVARAEESTNDLYNSVNQVVDELKRELRKIKEKAIVKQRKGFRLFKIIKNRFDLE